MLRLAYDAQNRLRAVFDGRLDVRIDYDLAGNRSRVSTKVTTQSGGTEQIKNSATLFTYDAMNRQKSSYERSLDGSTLYEFHEYSYDLAGNRSRDTMHVKGGGANGADLGGTYVYTYDDLHRITRSILGTDERNEYLYDGAGRAVATRNTVYGRTGNYDEFRYNQYDATGKLQDTKVVTRDPVSGAKRNVTALAYHDTTGSNAATGLGYDNAGNLKGYQQISDGSATTTRYQYATLNGSYLQSQATTTRGSTTATSNTWRDANGFISNITENNADGSATFKDLRFNRAFVNDAQGNALYVNQAAGQTGRIQNGPGGYIGGWVGDSLDPGHIQRQLVANGEVLGRYGDAPDRINTTPQGQVPKYVHTTDFQLEAQVLNLKGASVDPVSYTVVGGETLRDVARNVLGDASLWWRIADANALAVSADAPLTAGQTLSVPKLALNANNAETFQPYDPSKITGSMDPTLPMPAQGDKCGGMGKIIMAVVAIVVTIYTAGALSAGTSGFFSTMQAGTSALAGGGGLSAGGAALSAAAGSVVSQVVGNALGVQDGFSWRAVALSALSGGIGFGLSEMGVAGSIAKATSSNFLGAAGQAAIANALTQGVSVATGLQRSFDWRGVAASAVGAGVGAVVGESLGMNSPSFKTLPFGEQFGARLTTGLVAGTAAAVARGGKVAIQQVAVDAFGNALGQSLAAGRGQMAGSSSSVGGNRESIYSLSGTGARLSGWTEQPVYDSPYDDTYRQANLERMDLLARGSEPDGRTAARVQEDWLTEPSGLPGGTGTSSLIDAPTLVGRNAQGGYRWSSDFDSYPVASKTIQGTALEPLPPIGLAAGSAQDYNVFSRASMNEYWGGDDLLSRGMRAVGNAVYDVATALTPADSTPQELQRARELGQLRQSFNAARSAGDVVALQNLQSRHAQLTNASGNPSMVQVSMASDILRAQTAQGLSADRSSLGLAAGAAFAAGISGVMSPRTPVPSSLQAQQGHVLIGDSTQNSYVGAKGAKPLNSPDPVKWIEKKGGTVWTEMDGTWVYQDRTGNVVRYPNGYPDFNGGGYVRQSVNIATVPNHSTDFINANRAAPLGEKLPGNTWHHHQNGTTLEEIDKIIHSTFTHRGGVSIKKNE